MATTRLQEYKEMKLRMEGRRNESDRNWDRDWDVAHGHAASDDDDYDDDSDLDGDNDQMWKKNTGSSDQSNIQQIMKAQEALDSAQSDFAGKFSHSHTLDVYLIHLQLTNTLSPLTFFTHSYTRSNACCC